MRNAVAARAREERLRRLEEEASVDREAMRRMTDGEDVKMGEVSKDGGDGEGGVKDDDNAKTQVQHRASTSTLEHKLLETIDGIVLQRANLNSQ